MASNQYKYFLFILLISFSNSWANDEEIGRKLTGYEPSYFVLADDGVDKHGEFKVSIKYPLDEDVRWLTDAFKGSNVWYFAYTGKYDFFLFSDEGVGRNSAPVVSRIQNPGLFIKHKVDSEGSEYGFKSVSVGWFHESNGQQIIDNTTFSNTVNASDYVSRGWDYLGIDFKHRKKSIFSSDGHMDLYTRLRFICGCQGFGSISGREDDIRILGGTETADIRDFDGLRLILNDYVFSDFQYGLQLRTGITDETAFDNWSYRFEISFRLENAPIISDIPFTLFYFNGYGENISTYHIKNDYIGFGIKIW